MEDKSTNQVKVEEQPLTQQNGQQEIIEGNGQILPEKDVQEGQKEEEIAEDGNVEDNEAEEDVGVEKDQQENQEEEEDQEYEEYQNEEEDAQQQEQDQEAAEQAQPQTENPAQHDAPAHQGPTSTIHETLITPTPTCNCCNHSAGSEIFCQQVFDPQPLQSEYEQQSQSQIQHVYSQQQPAEEWRDDELVIRREDYGFLEQEYDFVVRQTEEEMIDQAEEEVQEQIEEKENLEMAVQVELVEPKPVVEHEVKEMATQIAKPITMKSAPPTSNVPKGQEARLVEEPKQEIIVKIEEVKQVEQPLRESNHPEEPQPAAPIIEQTESTNIIKTELQQQPKKQIAKVQQRPAEKPKMKKKVKKETKDPKASKSVQPKNVQTKKVTEVAQVNPPIIAQKTQPKVEEQKPQVKLLPKEETRPIVPSPPVKPEDQKPEQKKYEVKIVEKSAFKSTKKNDQPIAQDEQPAKNQEIPHQAPNNALLLRNRIHQAELEKKEKQEPPTAEELIDPKKDEPKVEDEQPKPKAEREQPHSKMGPAKKKKKKKIVPNQAPKNNKQPNKEPASQVYLRYSSELKSQLNSRRSSKLNSEIDPSDKASIVHQSRDPSEPGHPSQRNMVNMISPELIAAESQRKMPILTSLIVVKQAEKERVGTTYKMFLKYNYEYQRTVSNYRRIVDDVCNEISKKKQSKRPLQRILEDYFEDFCKQCREYNQRCYKIQIQDQVVNSTNNKFANIRLQMKKGFDQMVYLRKSIANNSHRLNGYVTSTVLNNIRKAFEVYHSLISQEENKQKQRREEYFRRAKIFNKVLDQVDKNFNKGLQGKVKDDLFIEITRFINEEKVHRVALRTFGRGLIDLRNTFIKCQKELFDSLQDIVNKFKTQSRAIYCFGPRVFDVLHDYSQEIKTSTRFLQLCTLTDLDYIKYVLQIQSKKETNEFSNRNFQSYLDLVFFDRVVGNIRDTLKGATNKSFPMENPSEELIHSISGNLVLFSREHDLCKDKYQIKNLNAKIIGAGFVQFDELIKGLIFDDNRTIRLKLKDEDRAQQLICYLNEKEEDILLDHGRKV